jgi:hypothetical protein
MRSSASMWRVRLNNRSKRRSECLSITFGRCAVLSRQLSSTNRIAVIVHAAGQRPENRRRAAIPWATLTGSPVTVTPVCAGLPNISSSALIPPGAPQQALIAVHVGSCPQGQGARLSPLLRQPRNSLRKAGRSRSPRPATFQRPQLLEEGCLISLEPSSKGPASRCSVMAGFLPASS